MAIGSPSAQEGEEATILFEIDYRELSKEQKEGRRQRGLNRPIGNNLVLASKHREIPIGDSLEGDSYLYHTPRRTSIGKINEINLI